MRFPKRFSTFLILVIAAVLVTACGGGDGVSIGDGDVTAPDFDGIVLSYSSTSDSATLHWVAATDDVTATGDLTYNVYQGIANDVSSATLVYSVAAGSTSHTWSGLIADTSYWYYVAAEDAAGNASTAPLAMTEVKTQPRAVVTKAAFKILTGTPTADPVVEDRYLVSDTLSVGDVVVIDAATTNTLRRVTAVNLDGTVDTVDAVLSELIENGVINTTISFPNDIEGNTALSAKSVDADRVRYTDPEGAFSITSQNFGDAPAAERSTAERSSDIATYAKQMTLYNDIGNVELGYTTSFTPDFATLVQYNKGIIVDSPLLIRVYATGELSIDAMVGYYLSGAASIANVTSTLAKKTLTANYFIGTVPVTQEITVEIKADFQFNAAAALDIESKLNATKTVGIGFVWEPGVGATLLKKDGVTKTITFDVSAQGGLTATVNVYPEISTKFYKSATGSMEIVPSLNLAAQARILPLPVELTQFDVDFKVDGYVGADLTIFGANLFNWTSPPWNLLTENMFSLPTIDLVSCSPSTALDIDQTSSCTVAWTNGTNNVVDAANIAWESETAGAMTLSPATDSVTTTVTSAATTAGQYNLLVSAYGSGFLGSAGTRYFSVPFDLTYTAPVSVGAGTYTGLVAVSNDPNTYDWIFDLMSITLNADGSLNGALGTVTIYDGSTIVDTFTGTLGGTWSGSTFTATGSFTADGEPMNMEYSGTVSSSAMIGTIALNHDQFGAYHMQLNVTLPKAP